MYFDLPSRSYHLALKSVTYKEALWYFQMLGNANVNMFPVPAAQVLGIFSSILFTTFFSHSSLTEGILASNEL